MKLSIIASVLIFWNCLLQNCYGVCDDVIKVHVNHFKNTTVMADICWITPRNLHGASHNTKHILIITCDHRTHTYRYEVRERGRSISVNLPCGHSCSVSVFLENDLLVQQMNFFTTLPLMPIAEVIPQNDVEENVSLLVRSRDNIPMTCGSPRSVVLNMTGETESSLQFTNWTWNRNDDIVLDGVLSNCDLPKNVTVHYDSSLSTEATERNSSLMTLFPGMHKLPLLVIGKAENPRCFKNINKKALPVHYYSQKNAWMDTRIFLEWFHNQFVPAVTKYLNEKGLPTKALLLLDNAPSHPDVKTLVSSNGSIKALFLPPNTTALFQPMDQGVIEALKRRYRKALLQRLLLEDKEGRSIVQFVKQINMKDVVYMTATAWDDLLPLTFTRSWNKLLGGTSGQLSSSDEPEENDEVLELARQLDSNVENRDIDDWMDVDCRDEGYQMLSDEDIIRRVTQTDQATQENDDDEEEDEVIQNVPKAGEVKDMLDKCLLWYERQNECTSTSLLLLKQLGDLAAAKRYANLKQLTLDSFFA